jgi:hypothetical protein
MGYKVKNSPLEGGRGHSRQLKGGTLWEVSPPFQGVAATDKCLFCEETLFAAGVVDYFPASTTSLLNAFLISPKTFSGSWKTNLFSNLKTVNPNATRYLSLFLSFSI